MKNRPEVDESQPDDVDVCERLCKPEPVSVSADVETSSVGRDRGDGRDARGRIVDPDKVGASTRFRSETAATRYDGGFAIFKREGRLTPDLAAQRVDDMRGWTLALGGPDTVTPQEATLVELAAGSVALARLALRHWTDKGAFTDRGRMRPSVGVFLNAADRATRILSTLGLQRRPKDAMTLETYLQQRYGDRRSGLQDAPTGEARADQRPEGDLASTGQPDGFSRDPDDEVKP